MDSVKVKIPEIGEVEFRLRIVPEIVRAEKEVGGIMTDEGYRLKEAAVIEALAWHGIQDKTKITRIQLREIPHTTIVRIFMAPIAAQLTDTPLAKIETAQKEAIDKMIAEHPEMKDMLGEVEINE